MKNALLIILFICLSSTAFAQKSRPGKRSATKPAAVQLSEKEQFEKASALEAAAERVLALKKFLVAYPNSEYRVAGLETIAASRVLMAEDSLNSADPAGAVELYRLVIEEGPHPYSDQFFSESIAKIPSTLFWRGQRSAAAEAATLIEKKVSTNVPQLLELANFYISVENGAEALRIANAAASADPASSHAQSTIALAHRMNFDLDSSAASYAKALELDPANTTAKRGLAEMKRAMGKPDEAIVLYREMLAANENSPPARTGLILSLFNAGQRAEAEAEMAKVVEQNQGNVILLAGAAYWYAIHGDSSKAVELSRKAIEMEPRYIWSHIALGRAEMARGNPVEAERVLVKARQYGNFPTLEYEIASARLMAGFFREAAEDLRKSFAVAGSKVQANLGGRVPRAEPNMADLVAYERRASIFEPVAEGESERAMRLKALLDLSQKINVDTPDETAVALAADEFASGTDKMRVHRQLFAANALLRKKVALQKALELTAAATGHSDDGLDVPSPGAAVMASELYDSRTLAFSRNEYILVPEVPRQTLSAILRGNIEEITGWSLYQQNNFPEAIIRLKRAVSVMPADSSWWRSSMWRLGAALEAAGNDKEALDSYIASYKIDKPDFGKYVIVESLYKKVNGTSDGLAEKLGSERVTAGSPALVAPQRTIEPPPVVQQSAPVVIPASIPAETNQVITESVNRPTPEVRSEPVPETAALPVEPIPVAVESKEADASAEAKSADVPTVTAPVIEPETKEVTETVVDIPEPAITEPAQNDAVEAQPQTPIVEPVSATETQQDEEPAQGETKTERAPVLVQETPIEEPKTDEAIVEQPALPAPPAEIPEPDKQALPVTPDAPEPATISKTVNKSQIPPANKPLFEPVIITIPKSEPVALTSSATDITTGAARTRVIEGRTVKEAPRCWIGLSQDNLSLINTGGTAGLLVRMSGEGKLEDVTAVSSSPSDIEVIYDPEISVRARRFYAIRSLSGAVGVYQITFSAPCGTKDLIVTVR